MGVLRDDIVLGLQPPDKRQYTDYGFAIYAIQDVVLCTSDNAPYYRFDTIIKIGDRL